MTMKSGGVSVMMMMKSEGVSVMTMKSGGSV